MATAYKSLFLSLYDMAAWYQEKILLSIHHKSFGTNTHWKKFHLKDMNYTLTRDYSILFWWNFPEIRKFY
jgi:hypothetical protein